jgi:hypothetical protein
LVGVRGGEGEQPCLFSVFWLGKRELNYGAPTYQIWLVYTGLMHTMCTPTLK